MGFLAGKHALIVGLLSNRSIAFGIAQAMHREGAKLALTFQHERFKDRVTEMGQAWNSSLIMPCDVGSDEQIEAVFKNLGEQWPKLDIIVHSVAYAPADQLEGDYIAVVNREGFRIAHDISSYSLAALAKAGFPLMKDTQGSILTLTYQGSKKVAPNYNVMGIAKASLEANVRYLAYSMEPHGIRVNAISAGPIKTLAASGIKSFRKMLQYHEKTSPLKRNTNIEEVGNTAAFLCSDLASGITGEIVHVDCGYHIVDMGLLENNDH